jgi:hypothetical protein
MPLVFIHGVNVRDSPAYRAEVQARDALFRRFTFAHLVPDPGQVALLNPYWGDLGSVFRWNHASLPVSGVEQFGPEDELAVVLLSQAGIREEPNPDTVLLTVARRSLPEAVDLLWALSAQRVADADEAANLADLAVRAGDYAEQNPQPGWLTAVADDRQFVSRLSQEVDVWQPRGPVGTQQDRRQWEAFGFDEVWDHIREARLRLTGAAGALTSRLLLEAVRTNAHKFFARFLGDAFVYLRERGTANAPGPIIARLSQALEQARQHITPADPKLIVVAHSMGGNITYDLLSHFRPDLAVDVLITVGSQVALFEEMKLFLRRDDHIPSATAPRMTKPANIGCWLNIYDENDVFAFATERVFAGPRDFAYSTGQDAILAHSSYFVMPSFHLRLAARLRSDCP